VFYKRGDPEDPRLGEVVQRWTGGPVDLRPGQPVLLGFPCDEGVRRNGGRVGAAQAPDAIRQQLYRFTTWDPCSWLCYQPTNRTPARTLELAPLGLLDIGNVRVTADLEVSQQRLGAVVASLFAAGTVPIVLGGGHETAFGHYLGYVQAGLDCAIINVDAHLDVRRYSQGAHSGSPFRQALEHPTHPLRPGRYVVFGAQRQSVARAHWEFVQQHQGRVIWCVGRHPTQFVDGLLATLIELKRKDAAVFLSVDADAFCQADVPAVSAPSPVGLDGEYWPKIAEHAAGLVRSLEIVEVNPALDRDHQTARWAALGIRQFLVGLAQRGNTPTPFHN
jgi:formiminoglutamase